MSEKVENAKQVRLDSTVTATDILPHADNSLLWDCVRIMVRHIGKGFELSLVPLTLDWVNHSRAAKKRAFEIRYVRGEKKHKRLMEAMPARTTLNRLKRGVLKIWRFTRSGEWPLYRWSKATGFTTNSETFVQALKPAFLLLNVLMGRNGVTGRGWSIMNSASGFLYMLSRLRLSHFHLWQPSNLLPTNIRPSISSSIVETHSAFCGNSFPSETALPWRPTSLEESLSTYAHGLY